MAPAAVSFFINAAGGPHGAMQCDLGPHSALGLYLAEMRGGPARTYPPAPWLALPLLLVAALFARESFRRGRAG